MKNRIFVTGATGFIGSFFVDELINQGANLVAGVNKENINVDGICTCKIDVTKISSLKKSFRKGDVIVHLAARTGPGHIENPLLDFKINALGTLNVLKAAKDIRAEKVVNISTYEVYGENFKNPVKENAALNPRNPYATSTLTGEYYANIFYKIFNLRTVNLRLFNVYGPGMYVKKRKTVIPIFTDNIMKNENITIFGDKNTALDFVYVGDVTKAIKLAIESECSGETINIGTGKATKLKDIALIISKSLGKESKPVIEYKKIDNKKKHIIYAHLAKAARILGFSPSTSIEEGIIRYIKSDILCS